MLLWCEPAGPPRRVVNMHRNTIKASIINIRLNRKVVVVLLKHVSEPDVRSPGYCEPNKRALTHTERFKHVCFTWWDSSGARNKHGHMKHGYMLTSLIYRRQFVFSRSCFNMTKCSKQLDRRDRCVSEELSCYS